MTQNLPTPPESGRSGGEDAAASANDGTPESNEHAQLPPEILEKIPKAQREYISSFMSMFMSGPMPNPIVQRVTSEHIGIALQANARETELDYADRKHGRLVASLLTVSVILIITVLCGILVWSSNTALLLELFKMGGPFLAGIAGGYGIGKTRKDR